MTDEILTQAQVVVPGTATTKDDAIREAGKVLVDAGNVTQAYVDAMFDRETSVSTYMGNLLAIPHGTNEAKEAILRSGLSVVKYDQPIDWNGNPVRFVIGIAGVGDEHLGILSKIAILFSEEDSVETLLQANTSAELYAQLEGVNEE
jgi:mannitol PTS system EIIA component